MRESYPVWIKKRCHGWSRKGLRILRPANRLCCSSSTWGGRAGHLPPCAVRLARRTSRVPQLKGKAEICIGAVVGCPYGWAVAQLSLACITTCTLTQVHASGK